MKHLLSYFIRFAICALLLVVYFYGWRPVRTAITQNIVYPRLAEAQKHPGSTDYTIKNNGVVLWITSKQYPAKEIQYRPQGGLFFLIAFLTLIMTGASMKWYLYLSVLHLLSTLLTAGLMIFSSNGWYPGFILVDLIGTYLVPAVSLALAAWVFALTRHTNSESN